MSIPISMTATQKPLPGSEREQESQRGAVVSSGWLGAEVPSDAKSKAKISGALVTSLLIHGGVLAFLAFGFAVATKEIVKTDPLEYVDVVFLKDPGPGGGGGGSPAPAPPKKLEIAKHDPPPTVPVPVPVPPIDPPPMLVAPIETTSATLLQAAGTSSVSLAMMAGGGSGGGLGPGKGNGVGPGTGGGFGDGAFAPGNGVTWPEVRTEVKPKYTPDAMRAKITGAVELEIIVKEDGTVGDVRITKSLDRVSGLDEAAREAAKKWRFTPGMKDGKPVATKVGLVLEFRLH